MRWNAYILIMGSNLDESLKTKINVHESIHF